jgi:ABC-type polysaccharide/polyol phosphate transport system ATPase subunit
MKPAVRVENLSKRYRLGQRTGDSYRTLRDSLVGVSAGLWNRLRGAETDRPKQGDFWALKDVSFEIQPGEVVGIIGRNGAGKSTLLKILSRIVEPTSGRATIHGRVGSLLEVGTGFHQELTGRENIYLNGAILGMKREEINRKFDEIVAFSEIEQFLDTPVKRYSSGMYVRLAFAVAAHLEPEILIVDEVLAVGDSDFQQKCLGKMDAVAKNGRTVLFVSHNLQSVARLTNRCVYLQSGQCLFDGPTSESLAKYHSRQRIDVGQYTSDELQYENRVRSAKVVTSGPNGRHSWGEPIKFQFLLDICQPEDTLCFSFQIVNQSRQPVCHFWLFDTKQPYCMKEGVYKLTCVVPHFRLYMGTYSLTTWLSDKRTNKMFENLTHICQFEVSMDNVSRPQYEWGPTDCIYIDDFRWEPILAHE